MPLVLSLSLSLSLSLDAVGLDAPVVIWYFGWRRPNRRTHILFNHTFVFRQGKVQTL